MANIYDLADTWNEGSTVFDAIKMNVTDTASAAASTLLDLRLGGAKKVEIIKSGAFQSYNTYTDASNYERAYMRWESNVFVLGAERAGTGTERALRIGTGSNNLSVTTSATTGIELNINNGSNVNVMTGGAAGSLTRGLRCGSFFEFTNNRTIANLPSTPAVGMIVRVTDANAPAIGSTVASGGAAAALVWYNGTNWTVIGV